MRFTNKTVIVTGGASGQGEEECRRLARENASVIVADINDVLGAALVAEITAAGGTARFVHLDVTDQTAWQALRDSITAEGGKVDGLVNNAGIGTPGRIGDVSLETWNLSYAVNATGAFLGIQTIFPIMNRGASIVNIGSIASFIAHHNVAYGAAKWALRGLSKTASVDLAAHGIRVNMVHPGYIKTPLNANASPVFLDAHLSLTPLGRGGEVDEVANAVLFLLSEESSYITGAELTVDGGFTGHAGSKPVYDALDAAAGL